MLKSGFVVLAAILISAPAIAQVATSGGDDRLDQVVCRSMPPPVGTRIGGERICKTQRGWIAYEDKLNRLRVLQIDTQNNMGSTGAP